MIVAKQKLTKKKIIIYVVIIFLMVVGNIVIYFRNSQTNLPASDYLADLNGSLTAETPTSPVASEPGQGATNTGDQSVLNHELFNALKKIGDWPIVPQNVGKADPFAPFFSTQ